MKSFWISWYHEQSFGAFELHSPWWVSGSTDTANTVCAAVRAEDEEHAKCDSRSVVTCSWSTTLGRRARGIARGRSRGVARGW